MAELILVSVVTCPVCGFAKAEPMATDRCQFLYRCEGCGAILRPKPGDCCVFCSYGSVRCPPEQLAAAERARASEQPRRRRAPFCNG